MPQTALFVERDPTYLYVTRKLRGTMTREEWKHQGHRQSAIDGAWKQALADIRQWDATAEFVTPLPVTLYVSSATGAVVVADIRRNSNIPIWITQTGTNLLIPPHLGGTFVRRTTYARWAEGPLPHLEGTLMDAPTPDTDPEVQKLRAQNRAIREALDTYMWGANHAQMPRSFRPNTMSNLIDFRIRGVFRIRDHRLIDSKQADYSAKLRTSDGVLDLGEDGIAV